jgi:prepilin-type processing-associated H-X9-DG protein
MNDSPHNKRAVTITELLVVVVIVAVLVGLVIPAVSKIRDYGDRTACLENLRQIGVATLLYAGDHDQTLPVVEPYPFHPILDPQEGARPLKEVLAPYGLRDENFRCRSDVHAKNLFGSEGTSYIWFELINGKRLIGGVQITDTFFIPLNMVNLAVEEENGKHRNAVFADGSVVNFVK